MNPFVWAHQSIKNRGILQTSRIAGSAARDFLFDWRYGTDTFGRVPVKDLQVDSENKTHAGTYQATKARPFLQLLRHLGVPNSSGFVDFGSGKGRVLLLAAMYGFRRIVGVEFSPELCASARENVATFANYTKNSRIEVVEGDATRFEITSELNVFYFYNPFDAPVMFEVLGNISRSLATHPRRAWLIYNTPRHDELVRHTGLFQRREVLDFGGTEFAVHST